MMKCGIAALKVSTCEKGPIMPEYKKITTLLGLQRSTIGMLLMVILVGMGERMAERFLPVYLIALGGGPVVIGLLNGLDNLMSALYAFPGGYLSDRLGFKKALLVFNARLYSCGLCRGPHHQIAIYGNHLCVFHPVSACAFMRRII
jgi:MFS family permease